MQCFLILIVRSLFLIESSCQNHDKTKRLGRLWIASYIHVKLYQGQGRSWLFLQVHTIYVMHCVLLPSGKANT